MPAIDWNPGHPGARADMAAVPRDRRHGVAVGIGSGPWMLPIVGLLLASLLSLPMAGADPLAMQFQASVVHLMAASLILTGPVSLYWSRLAADRWPAGGADGGVTPADALRLPAFHALMLLTTVLAGLVGLACVTWLFPQQSALYRLLMLAGFVLMCQLWIAAGVLAGHGQYRALAAVLAPGYAVAIGAALAMRGAGLEGQLGGFVLGLLGLLIGTVTLIYRHHHGGPLFSFGVFDRRHGDASLLAIGLTYAAAVWTDPLMLWYAGGSGEPAGGPLPLAMARGIPALLAYLAIVPGIAVLAVRVEPDLLAHWRAFDDAVRGGSLARIEQARQAMVRVIRLGLYQVVKVQAIASLLLYASGGHLLALLGFAQPCLPLLHADVVAAGLQVVLLSVLAIYRSIDGRAGRHGALLLLCAGFLLLNVVSTGITLALRPSWHGYGVVLALLIVLPMALVLLHRRLRRLVYETCLLR